MQWGRSMKEHYAFGELQIAQPGWNTEYVWKNEWR